jgi:mRNA interferase MazF
VRRTVLLLSSDGINDSPRPWLLGIELRDTDPGDILAVPVEGGRLRTPAT